MKNRTPRPPQFKIKLKRGLSGFGLFALEDIPKRRFVIEYWGKLVPDSEIDVIGGKYLFALGNGKTISGATRNNLARYINHSCKPNCEVEIVGNRVLIYSRKKIKAGDELTYDYGKEYWDYYINPYCCRCAGCKNQKKKNRS